MITSLTEQELEQIDWEDEGFFWETFRLRMQQIRDLYLGTKSPG